MDNMVRLGIEGEGMGHMSLLNERSYRNFRKKHKEKREEGGIVRGHELNGGHFYVKVEK